MPLLPLIQEATALSTAEHHSSVMSWARLVRLPAVFTVIAQVAAAYLFVAGSGPPMWRLLLVILAGISLYWSGMIINDLWDFDEDTRERPGRPLPKGEVSLGSAKAAAWGLMAAGIVIASVSGYVPAQATKTTLWPAIIAVATAACILLYNGPLKQTLLAPPTMGLCRLLSFLLGAAPLTVFEPAQWVDFVSHIRPHVLAAAIGMGIYIMGITLISQVETTGGRKTPLAFGTLIIAIGAICMAAAPNFAPPGTLWKVLPPERFAILIGLIAATIVVRGIRVTLSPEVARIQGLIRIGILSLIPFSAAITMMGAGPLWALAVFALVVPAMFTAARIRVT
ncbi:MAG: UbiA family prenyltransferase [Planctomycetaceae bacterium]